MDKARSQGNCPSNNIKNEPSKRKSFDVNEAVRTLDLALGRLKKSKMVNGVYCPNTPINPTGAWGTDTFLGRSNSHCPQGLDNTSSMSMNFSHYELIRNLSRSNCNSESTVSGSTGNPSDPTTKNEHLEKYFLSAEMWTHNLKSAASNNEPNTNKTAR